MIGGFLTLAHRGPARISVPVRLALIWTSDSVFSARRLTNPKGWAFYRALIWLLEEQKTISTRSRGRTKYVFKVQTDVSKWHLVIKGVGITTGSSKWPKLAVKEIGYVFNFPYRCRIGPFYFLIRKMGHLDVLGYHVTSNRCTNGKIAKLFLFLTA